MITVVIETFARCQLYRLLWPWYLLFPKLARKVFCATFAILVLPPERSSYVFLTLDAIFTRIFRAFSQIFSKSKLFGVRLQSLHPHLQHHWFSLRFIKIGLKQIYCNYSGTQKIQNNFLKFMLLFLRSSLLMIRNKRIGKNFLFVISFHWPQPFYCFPSLQLLRRPEYPCCVKKIRQNVGLQTWIWRYIVTSQTACIQ